MLGEPKSGVAYDQGGEADNYTGYATVQSLAESSVAYTIE